MTKKVLCLVVILAMFITMTPYAAAQEETFAPTVEEILADFHAKTFAITTADASTADYSRQAAPVQSRTAETAQKLANITSDTVNALNNAGYEAYNVTSDNYLDMEEILRTDLSSLGLSPDGSYIVTISGENPTDEGESPQTRGLQLPPHIWDDPYSGSAFFTYTYEGVTYTMRYVTITGSDGQHMLDSDSINLLETFPISTFLDILTLAVSILTFREDPYHLGFLYSLLLGSIPTNLPARPQALVYNASTVWTKKYTQIYNYEDASWSNHCVVDFAVAQSSQYTRYFDSATNSFVETLSDPTNFTEHSPHYYDEEWQKESAARAYSLLHNCANDSVTEVKYKIGETIIVIHEFW